MQENTIFIGLDVHKNSFDIPIAKAGGDKEVRYPTIQCTPESELNT